MDDRRTTTQGHGGYASERWVIYMEIAATVLIALGVLLDMLAAHGYLADNALLRWAEDSFFVFQIPVYYLAFGYAYQHTWRVDDGRMWLRCVGRQLILCLVPFLSITLATLLVDAGLGQVPLDWHQLATFLFTSPVSPVAFYPILLLMYFVTPTLRSWRGAGMLLAMALALKAMAVALPMDGWPYVLSGLCGSWLWFCLGMAFCLHTHAHAERFLPRLLGTSRLAGVVPVRGNVAILGVAWLALSVVASLSGFAGTKVGAALLTLVGLAWFTSIFATAFAGGRSSRLFDTVGKSTIGIFLLHPICLGVLFFLLRRPRAAGALAGMDGTVRGTVAFLLALVAAYAVPVALQWVLDHAWKLGFLLKPARYLPTVRQH